MAGIRSVTLDARHRARRWDAIVIGSGVSGLIAATRLGMRQHRVLVVSEAAAEAQPECVREPFLLTGAREGGALAACLRELKVPLIDRRRIADEPVAYQVIGDDLRIDIGELAHTANELVAWDLAKPDEGRAMLAALEAAARSEGDELMQSPLVRSGRRLGLGRGQGGGAGRGLPAAVGNASAALGRLFAAQVRALANHASGGPSSEACARILGSVLAGGAAIEPGAAGLLPLLRRRVESLYGEFRTLRGGFDLINADGLPGMVLDDTGEVWLGKTLIVAAAPSALHEVLASPAAAKLVGGRRGGARRRLAMSWRAQRRVLPVGMARRIVLLGSNPDDPQAGVATVAVHAPAERSPTVDLVGRVVIDPGEDAEQVAARLEERLHAVMPFSEGALERVPLDLPVWDDDDLLEEVPAGTPWPGEAELRVSSRLPVYRLDRAAVAGLGLEGDVLLGWRGGDVIAGELS